MSFLFAVEVLRRIESIPESLSEAARIDGAGHFTILFKIILPLSKSILAVMALYYGVGTWNGWFWGSTILTDRTCGFPQTNV